MESFVEVGTRNRILCKRDAQWIPLQKGHAMESSVERTRNGILCRRDTQWNPVQNVRKNEILCGKGTQWNPL